VSPELMRRHPGPVLVKRTIKTVGIGEAQVDETLSPLLKSTNPSIGIYARADGIHVRIAAKADMQEEARRLIEPVEAEVRKLLGTAVWGADDDTFESVVGELMKARNLTMAAMESCTGGLLSDTITNVTGSGDFFLGALVSYATEVKEMFGVDPEIIKQHGVVSPETAAAMAAEVRKNFGTDVGIGITGVAGTEPVDGAPAGQVYIGIDGGEKLGKHGLGFQFPQSRPAIKRRAVTQALMLLRRALLGE